MARVYAPAPPPGPIKLSLVGLKLSAAIARTKAEAFVAVRDAIPKSFISDGLFITVLDRPTLVVVEGPAGARYGIAIRVRVTDTMSGAVLLDDHAFNVYNPPYEVWNGTWTYVDGGVHDRPNFQEDLSAAFKEIVNARIRDVLGR